MEALNDGLRVRTFSAEASFLLLQIVAFWGVWHWLAARYLSTTDAVWGLLPLLAIAFLSFAPKSATRASLSSSPLVFAAIFLTGYAISYAVAPPMARAILAFVSLTILISAWRFGRSFDMGIFLLFLLGLPLTESLNFYLGYPMRVVVGEAVVALLGVQGLDIYREGVCLHFGNKLIWIDAPCSGVKMLWFGTFLTVLLSCFYRLGWLKLLLALAAAFTAIMIGNILRASSLFYIEAGLISAPEWAHSAVGVIAFAIISVAIVVAVNTIAGIKWPKSSS